MIRNTFVALLAVAKGLLILLGVRSLVAPVSAAAHPPTGTAV
jgi:hypothetical protein